MNNSLDLKLLGSTIKKHRILNKLSQEELGFRCDIHRTTIGLIENGMMDPKYTTLKKLIKALNIPHSEIFK
jgi:DNA-binding XRE family transcriptional regulator